MTLGVAANPVSAGKHYCDATVEPGDSIQSAIDAADSGDVICVKPGTYAEELDVNTEGLAVVGLRENKESPTIESDVGGGQRIVELTAPGCTVGGFFVQATATGASPNEFAISAENGTVTGNVVLRRQSGPDTDPASTPSEGNPAVLVLSSDATVEDNYLIDGPIGVVGLGASIENNQFVGEVPDEGIWAVNADDDNNGGDDVVVRSNNMNKLTTDTNEGGAPDIFLHHQPGSLNGLPSLDSQLTAHRLSCDNDVDSGRVADAEAGACPPVVDDVTPFPPQ